MTGFLANFFWIIATALSTGRSNSQQINPRVKMLRHLRIALLSIPESSRAARVIVVTGTSNTWAVTPSSRIGSSVRNLAFFSPSSLKESTSVMMTPPGFRNLTFCFNAAGFIATSTSHWSPGVCTPIPMLTWNPDTPPSDPCGARISAG